MSRIPDADIEECPVGFANHTWRFEILESTVALTPVENCTGSCQWWDAEHLGDIDLGVVKLRTATDCPGRGAYESGSHYISHPNACDCNHWLEPIPVTPGHWPGQVAEDARLAALAALERPAGGGVT
jgi:hypothetical protein